MRSKIKISSTVKKGVCRTVIFAGVSFFTSNIDNATESPRKAFSKKGRLYGCTVCIKIVRAKRAF